MGVVGRGVWSDEMERHAKGVLEKAEKNGWTVVYVSPSESSHAGEYSYTVGVFAKTGHPDFAVFGLPHIAGAAILNELARKVFSGESFETPGAVVPDSMVSIPMRLAYADQNWVASHMDMARVYEKTSDNPVLGVFWPDERGVYAFEKGFDPNLARWQPNLAKHPSESPAWNPMGRKGSRRT